MKGKTIILGISGGIAAYKSCELVRLLKKEGAEVHVVMTKAAQEFVTPLTFQTLSQNPVHTDLFSLTEEEKIGHIALADKADILCMAPATADLIARAAHGEANDLLTTLLLVTRATVLFCPSMNVNMWEHPATKKNIETILSLGYHILEPASGELACGYEGKGRLCEPGAIGKLLKEFLQSRKGHLRIKKTG